MLLLTLLRRLNDILGTLAVAIAGGIVAVSVLALFGGALTRYTTGLGYAWVLELPPLLMPWLVFPMMGVLLRGHRHIAVDILPGMASAGTLRVVSILRDLVIIAAAGVFLVAGIDAVSLVAMLGQSAEMEIHVPVWIFYVSFPAGFAMVMSFAAESLLRALILPEAHDAGTGS